MSKDLYDIIRFYSSDKQPRLIMSGVDEDAKDEWCESDKTSEPGEWFDGFTAHNERNYDCQNDKPMYPNNYTPDDL